MLKTNITTNITAQSVITDSHGVEQYVAYLNATIDKAKEKSKSVNINKSIQDMDLYNANKVAVEADFAAFEKQVYEICSNPAGTAV